MKVSAKNKATINQLIKSIPKIFYDEYYDGELPYELLVYADDDEFEVSKFVSFKNITELDKVVEKIVAKYKNKLNKIDFKWSESYGSFDQFTIYKS
jgi:division protein CdvB (Snf7/Vps24/ESCRT-III family)